MKSTARAPSPRKTTGRRPPKQQCSAGGIVVADGKVLLISTTGGQRWQLPKGHVERGETPAQAAAREIEEETGVRARVHHELGVIEYSFQSRAGRWIQKRVTYFLCSYLSGSVENFARHEVSGADWFPLQQGLEQLTFDNERAMVARARLELEPRR